jgi:hypothetical protein
VHDHDPKANAQKSLEAASKFIRSLATQIAGHKVEIGILKQRHDAAALRFTEKLSAFVRGGLLTEQEAGEFPPPTFFLSKPEPKPAPPAGPITEFDCPFCRKFFQYRYLLRNHVNVCPERGDRPIHLLPKTWTR